MLNSFKQSKPQQFILLLIVFLLLCIFVQKPDGYKYFVSAAVNNVESDN